MHAADGNQTGLEYWLITSRAWTADPFARHLCHRGLLPQDEMCINLTSGRASPPLIRPPAPTSAFPSCRPSSGRMPAPTSRYPSSPARAWATWSPSSTPNAAPKRGLPAPFLQEGIHYEIIAPPIAYLGQSFWITVIVKDTSGFTKTDYTGITSFTSTDPNAKSRGRIWTPTTTPGTGAGPTAESRYSSTSSLPRRGCRPSWGWTPRTAPSTGWRRSWWSRRTSSWRSGKSCRWRRRGTRSSSRYAGATTRRARGSPSLLRTRCRTGQPTFRRWPACPCAGGTGPASRR